MSYDTAWAAAPATPPSSGDYAAFLDAKQHEGAAHGFAPTHLPSWLFDFQGALVEWATRKGRGAIFADCGLGKTPMQLVWAQNVIEHTNRPVLILTPLAVGGQTAAESEKFGIAAMRSRDGAMPTDARIVITNYERLHYFSPSDFAGVVCDESSILKHFRGATQSAVTAFMRKVPYRLLCTATAAPNDYTELGTSSEALGELGMVDMLGRFFRQDDNFHQLHAMKSGNERVMAVAGTGGAWRLKHHAVTPFWKWVASWARACRKPSDLGFEDERFTLPDLIERDHEVITRSARAGLLFSLPATTIQEEREERRRTLAERVDLAARLVNHDQPAVVWCHLNDEGDALEKAIPGSVQVKGAHDDDEKEARYQAFADGSARVLVIKPKIGAWGLNWQHCAHVVTFASHSYEQYYQSVRRCWRFGQQRPVVVDIIFTEGETRVRENMLRKAKAADYMFAELVKHMRDAMRVDRHRHSLTIEVPAWLTR